MQDTDLKRFARDPGLLSQILGSDFPLVSSFTAHGGRVSLSLDVRPELAWFRGHFPGQPVLPGIIQLHWAVQVTNAVFGSAGVPQQIKRLKFSNVIVPPRVVELELERHGEREVQFSITSDTRQHSQGRIVFPGAGA